jgi:hypothetical protein
MWQQMLNLHWGLLLQRHPLQRQAALPPLPRPTLQVLSEPALLSCPLLHQAALLQQRPPCYPLLRRGALPPLLLPLPCWALLRPGAALLPPP